MHPVEAKEDFFVCVETRDQLKLDLLVNPVANPEPGAVSWKVQQDTVTGLVSNLL